VNVCGRCGQRVRITAKGKARAHKDPEDFRARCEGVGKLAVMIQPGRTIIADFYPGTVAKVRTAQAENP
jgi:hypothetical protein